MNPTIIEERSENIYTLTKNNNEITKIEYKLTSNNFNPEKFSPNIFLDKLKYRMKHYHLEEKLDDDVLEI